MLKYRSIVKIASVFVISVIISGNAICGEAQTSQRRTPIVAVYEKTHDSVVNISGTRLVSTSFSSGFGFPDIFESMMGPRLKQEVSVLGSGAVVHEDGYVMTNAHVVESAENIKIIFSNGDEFPATIIASDKEKDLALLKIQTDKKLPFVHLGRSDDLLIGETVIAIGNPYGYANTLTSGILSAVNRDIRVSEGTWLRGLIQTDVADQSGKQRRPVIQYKRGSYWHQYGYSGRRGKYRIRNPGRYHRRQPAPDDYARETSQGPAGTCGRACENFRLLYRTGGGYCH